MAKIIMLRLPEKVAKRVQEIAEKKAIGLSTAIREMICEHMNEIAPTASRSKMSVDAASTNEGVCQQ